MTQPRPALDLAPALQGWIDAQGWALHPHQASALTHADEPDMLLIAPTGGGKTMAGFLPSLDEITRHQPAGLHTLYISPLKALATDIRRNLTRPITEAGLPVRVEDRTGDSTARTKKRQRVDPPHILLTTPESLALLLSYPEAPQIFGTLQRVVIDEIHALAESKRGDQLFLLLARLRGLAPGLRVVALSATVADPPAMAARMGAPEATILTADPGPEPDIAMLETAAAPPWAGGGAHYAVAEVMAAIEAHKTTLIFHNTRAQCELFFHALWQANPGNLPIGIHHGSLSREARERVEAAMVAGQLRAVVATGSLDLGIDWGDVDLVIQIGAPKNVQRLVQRIGRAGHRYNAPSKARLVPANRLEVVECIAALEALRAGELDNQPRQDAPLDVLCQHILIAAASGPFCADALFGEVTRAGPYRHLSRARFDACLDLVATGGYALRAYDRWQRLKQAADGQWALRDPRAATAIRQNLGTIAESDLVSVRLRGRGGAPLGEIEEAFAAALRPGETFLMGGKIVRYVALKEAVLEVAPGGAQPRVAVFSGTKFATSASLSARIQRMIASRDWASLPGPTQEWLQIQARHSRLPEPGRLLCEQFPLEGRHHLVIWGFAGKNALQTLGLILTAMLEAKGHAPLGFVANDYGLMIWGLEPVGDIPALLDPGAMQSGFDAWLGDNQLMKRAFRSVATNAGLIERRMAGRKRSARAAGFSADILYDTLAKYQPDHLLMQITREEAQTGLVDFSRIMAMLTETQGRVDVVEADRVTALAAPLLLEVGRVSVEGEGRERLAAMAEADALRAAGLAHL